jgi:hypothetical protein
MKDEALIARLLEEATHELHHETVAVLLAAAKALAQPEQESTLQEQLDIASADCAKADANLDKALADLDKANADWDKAYADRDKAYADWGKAYAEARRIKALMEKNT